MGLAASQARLLTLTSRKNGVESQLLGIANDKLALSKESAKISESYSDALNAQKLVLNDNSKTINLTYDSMMTYNSTTSDVGQYLLQDSYGRVVLDDAYANLIGGNGNNSGGADTAKCTENEFLKSCLGLDKWSDACEYTGDYNNNNIVDTVLPVSLTTCKAAYSDMTSNLTSLNAVTSTITNQLAAKSGVNATFEDDAEKIGSMLTSISSDIDSQFQYETGMSSSEMASFNWDSLSYKSDSDGKTHYLRTTSDEATANKAIGTNSYNSSNTTNYDENSVVDYLIRLKRDVMTAKSLMALYQFQGDANNPTQSKMTVTQALITLFNGGFTGHDSDGTAYGNVIEPSSLLISGNDDIQGGSHAGVLDTYDVTYNAKTNWYTGKNNATGWNQEKLAQLYSLHGIDYNYDGAWANTAGGATAYKNYSSSFTDSFDSLASKYSTVFQNSLVSTTTGSTSSTTLQEEADYYKNLYEAIQSNGWKRSSAIGSSDGSNMQDMIKSGLVYMAKLDTNGNWKSVTTNNSECSVSETTDDDAITAAEAAYSAEKSKIEYKESQLDLKQNNLDTERSAITTEVDSVQKIIDASVKKFSLFTSG